MKWWQLMRQRLPEWIGDPATADVVLLARAFPGDNLRSPSETMKWARHCLYRARPSGNVRGSDTAPTLAVAIDPIQYGAMTGTANMIAADADFLTWAAEQAPAAVLCGVAPDVATVARFAAVANRPDATDRCTTVLTGYMSPNLPGPRRHERVDAAPLHVVWNETATLGTLQLRNVVKGAAKVQQLRGRITEARQELRDRLPRWVADAGGLGGGDATTVPDALAE